VDEIEVVSFEELPGEQVYYDFHVPEYENYAACGVWHHNTGKSLVTKALAAAWGLPLIRMDLGAMKGSLVGQSESNIRAALAKIDVVGNCIVLLDEIEKMLAGATGSLDSGVSADQLGVVLTWMEERTGGAFVAATANNIKALPPELIRRFDETWSVDLPTRKERGEILQVSLARFNRAGVALDRVAVVSACAGFTGAEIAQKVIPAALYAAFDDGMREITTADLVAAAGNVVPIARTSKEQIDNMRDWVKSGRARAASEPEEVKAASLGDGTVDLSGMVDAGPGEN
jgi:SpoVK/Ycf46/Vps4 family AAA+-type ATPase